MSDYLNKIRIVRKSRSGGPGSTPIAKTYKAITGNYTLIASDLSDTNIILYQTQTGNYTLTLPTGLPAGECELESRNAEITFLPASGLTHITDGTIMSVKTGALIRYKNGTEASTFGDFS